MENLNPLATEELLVSDEHKQAEEIAPEVTATNGEDQKEEQAKEKTFTQAELDALIQKRLLKEERRVHRRIEQQLREEAQQRQVQAEPKRENFTDDRAFIEARIEQLAEQKAAQRLAERETQREAEKLRETFEERAEKAAEKYADFDAVVRDPNLPISPLMAEFISLSEQGPDIAYHLGKNPTLAARLSKMSPGAAAVEMTRIATELSAVPKPKVRLSNAPEPITPVGNRGRASTSALPSDDDDIETWMRKESERQKRR